jgi:hypothetical protein
MSFLQKFSDNTVITLIDAPTITIDLSLSPHFMVTLAGNRTLGNPINVSAAKDLWIAVKQDGFGNKNLTFDTDWIAVNPSATINLEANAVSIIFAAGRDFGSGLKWYYTPLQASQISGDPFAVATYAKTAPNAGTLLYRRGDAITGITCSATYTSGPPTSASIANTFGGSTNGGDVDPGIWTISSPFASGSLAGSVTRIGSDLGADPTMTATLTAIKGVSRQGVFTIQWTRDLYYGVGVAGLSTESAVESLANTLLTDTRVRTIVLSPSNQKVYYSYPKAYGTATFTLNGFPASFLTPSELSLTNVNGVTSIYYLYESTHLLTGSNLNFVVT